MGGMELGEEISVVNRGLCLHCKKKQGQPYLCPDCRKKRDEDETRRDLEFRQMKCCKCGLIESTGWTGRDAMCPTCSARRCRRCNGTGVTHRAVGPRGTMAEGCDDCNGMGMRPEKQLEL
jgi:hypothetical protein